METTITYSTSDIEKLIAKLPDIISSRVVVDSDDIIQEIHILAGNSRNVKQLVRDIQSAINAEFKIDIDYKVISVAQVEEKDIREKRIKIDSIGAKNINNMIEAVVVIKDEAGSQFEGKSTKVKSKENKLRAVADATLNALELYLGGSGLFYLDNIEVIRSGGKSIICCIIGFSHNNYEDMLIGCSLSKADDSEATVKAVLDAVNRRINMI